MNLIQKFNTLIKLYLREGKKHRKLRGKPITIVGAPRSGTTLLLAILGAHPKILSVSEETNILTTPRSFKTPLLNKFKKTLEILSSISDSELKDSADRWCEKTPKNVLYLKEIIREFGSDIKIIHIVRDGRDVITSKHPLYPDKYFVEPEEWVNDVSQGLKWITHPNVYLIKYEELIENYEQALEGLCDFLELDSCSELMSFHKHTTIREFNSWKGKVRPLSMDSVGKYQNDANAERVRVFLDSPGAKELLARLYPNH